MKTTLPFLTICCLLFCTCGSLISERGSDHQNESVSSRLYPSSVLPDRIMQSITDNPGKSIHISWRTSPEVSESYLEYRPFSAALKSNDTIIIIPASVKSIQHENIHDHYFSATMQNLLPGSSYMIRVGNENQRSEWFKAQTAPEKFHPFSFLYFGDVQNDIKEYAPQLFRQASTHFPQARFLVHSGDLVLSSGNDDTWGEWFYAGGWLLQQIPSLPVAGNSDHFRLQEEPVDQRMLFPQWHGVFNLPKNGPEGLNNLTYYVDYHGLRIIALYTNFESTTKDDREIFVNSEVKLTEELFHHQLVWLEKSLSENNQPWLVVVMHHPVFTAREERHNELLQEYVLPMLEKYDVDLVLQGHDHVYARGVNPNGSSENKLPVYVISVAGGKARDIDLSHAWIDLGYEGMQLYQAIHIDEGYLKFEAFDKGGNRMDQFTITRTLGHKKMLDN